MIYYIFAAVMPLLIMTMKNTFEKAKNVVIDDKSGTILSILPMALMFALRYKRIGGDTIGYVRAFESIRNFSWSYCFSGESRHEIGFLLYEKVISVFTDNYTVYFIITAIILFGVLGRFAYKYSGNPYIFLFLFITLGTYQFYLTGLRQALAMTICLLAFDFIVSKKFWKFVFTVAVGYFFHKSAIVFLIAYPLCNVKKMSNSIALYGVTTVGLAVSFTVFSGFVNRLLGYNYGVEETGNGLIFLTLVLIFTVYGLLNINKIKDSTSVSQPIMHMSLITVMFWFLRLISRTMERPSYYFIIGFYAFAALAYKYGKGKEAYLINVGIIVISLALFIYRNVGITFRFFWS